VRRLPQPDLYRNLAQEEFLLDEGDPEPRLFIWRSPFAVVMGKNQNPWKECNLPYLHEHRIALARRVSGGGTVYHDPGNLNLCWAMDRDQYQSESPSLFLVQALSRLGLEAEVGQGGSVWVQGKKVSGSAFAFRRDRVLHHSTLLIEADLDRLRAVLSPTRIQLRTHAVGSVPAPVANLCELRPGCDGREVLTALEAEAESQSMEVESLSRHADAAHMQSWSWIWGQTPTFRIQHLRIQGETGTMEVRKGRMVSWQGENRREVTPPVPLHRKGVEDLEQTWGIPSGQLQAEFSSLGWWLPSDGPPAER